MMLKTNKRCSSFSKAAASVHISGV